MPIYEFYCYHCHTLYNFLSGKVDTQTQPACPQCQKSILERKVSRFSIAKKCPEQHDDTELPDIDEEKMEKAIQSIAGEVEGINEEDPQQVAQIMRKLYHASGLDMSGGMEEAIRRMESGEDPDKISEDMGDILEEEDPFLKKGDKKKIIHTLHNRLLPPSIDETLYKL